MLKYIDTHAHLESSFYKDNLENVRKDYLSEGVYKVINVACSKETTKMVSETAKLYGEVYFTVGCHPDSSNEITSEVIDYFKPFASDEKCIAVGEIGLDYFYKPFDREVQKTAFEKQIMLAKECNLPIIVHTRNATKDTVDILKANKNNIDNGFLMHCYGESKEITKILLDLGAYFAFGGASTFKNYKKQDVIQYIPLDRLFCETDCPYMTPEPFRGRVNEPKFVKYVYKNLANIKGVSEEDFESIVDDNFYTFFKKVKR